jgi:hypothetical protein
MNSEFDERPVSTAEMLSTAKAHNFIREAMNYFVDTPVGDYNQHESAKQNLYNQFRAQFGEIDFPLERVSSFVDGVFMAYKRVIDTYLLLEGRKINEGMVSQRLQKTVEEIITSFVGDERGNLHLGAVTNRLPKDIYQTITKKGKAFAESILKGMDNKEKNNLKEEIRRSNPDIRDFVKEISSRNERGEDDNPTPKMEPVNFVYDIGFMKRLVMEAMMSYPTADDKDTHLQNYISQLQDHYVQFFTDKGFYNVDTQKDIFERIGGYGKNLAQILAQEGVIMRYAELLLNLGRFYISVTPDTQLTPEDLGRNVYGYVLEKLNEIPKQSGLGLYLYKPTEDGYRMPNIAREIVNILDDNPIDYSEDEYKSLLSSHSFIFNKYIVPKGDISEHKGQSKDEDDTDLEKLLESQLQIGAKPKSPRWSPVGSVASRGYGQPPQQQQEQQRLPRHQQRLLRQQQQDVPQFALQPQDVQQSTITKEYPTNRENNNRPDEFQKFQKIEPKTDYGISESDFVEAKKPLEPTKEANADASKLVFRQPEIQRPQNVPEPSGLQRSGEGSVVLGRVGPMVPPQNKLLVPEKTDKSPTDALQLSGIRPMIPIFLKNAPYVKGDPSTQVKPPLTVPLSPVDTRVSTLLGYPYRGDFDLIPEIPSEIQDKKKFLHFLLEYARIYMYKNVFESAPTVQALKNSLLASSNKSNFGTKYFEAATNTLAAILPSLGKYISEMYCRHVIMYISATESGSTSDIYESIKSEVLELFLQVFQEPPSYGDMKQYMEIIGAALNVLIDLPPPKKVAKQFVPLSKVTARDVAFKTMEYRISLARFMKNNIETDNTILLENGLLSISNVGVIERVGGTNDDTYIRFYGCAPYQKGKCMPGSQNLFVDVNSITNQSRVTTVVRRYMGDIRRLLVGRSTQNFAFPYDNTLSNGSVVGMSHLVSVTYVESFFQKQESLLQWISQPRTLAEILSVYFQIFHALYVLDTAVGGAYTALSGEDISIVPVEACGYWSYKVYNKEYFVPNYGYMAILYGYNNLSSSKDVVSKKSVRTVGYKAVTEILRKSTNGKLASTFKGTGEIFGEGTLTKIKRSLTQFEWIPDVFNYFDFFTNTKVSAKNVVGSFSLTNTTYMMSLDGNGKDLYGFSNELYSISITGVSKEKYGIGISNRMFDKYGFDREGYNIAGYNREGYNRDGEDIQGYNKEGYDRLGFNREGYNKEGYNKQGYNRFGINRRGFTNHGYNINGINVYGYTAAGLSLTNKDSAGYDSFGRDRDGYDILGYDEAGYDRDGYNLDGYSRAGVDRYGFNREGFNNAGFDIWGNTRDKYGSNGRDENGYDKSGYDAAGFDRGGYNSKGKDKNGRSRRDNTIVLLGTTVSQ